MNYIAKENKQAKLAADLDRLFQQELKKYQ
jgi:hypothetical protein